MWAQEVSLPDSIERDCLIVGFRDGEGDFADALADELSSGDRQQHPGEAEAAVGGVNAELRDVAALRAYARAEHKRRRVRGCCGR